MGAEDVLQEQEHETGEEEPIHVSAEEAAELLGKTLASCFASLRFAISLRLIWRSISCFELLHWIIHACASSASSSAAAGFPASA